MKPLSNIEFREAATKPELEALFALRFSVYKEDLALSQMLSSSSNDLNIYDLNALHFGAFNEETPVAYIRLALNSPTHFNTWMEEILEEQELEFNANPNTFPFQNYYPDSTWSSQFIKHLNGKKIGEVGRLAIHPNYRQAGAVLDKLFLEFIAYCKHHHIQTAFGSCTLLLERYYRKFGFQRAENCIPFVYQNLPEAVIMRFDDDFQKT